MRATILAMAMLLTGCTNQPKDYVTQYDFTSARLVDLPWQMGAAMVGNNASFEYLDYVRTNHTDWNYVQYMLGRELYDDHTDSSYNVDDPTNIIPQYDRVDDHCRLENGNWNSGFTIRDGVVLADSDDPYRSVLEVKVLEYDDFNQDGYMDVLVRRTLGGSASPQEELVLTRKQSDGGFEVIEHKDRRFRNQELELGISTEQ